MFSTVILVGCGNMGFAMLKGWLKSKRLTTSSVIVVEPSSALREDLRSLGISAVASATNLPAAIAPTLVVFAIKPQLMRKVVPEYRALAAGGTAFLSLAAGTSIETLENLLGQETAIIRCMPNTPSSIGRGMLVTVSNLHVNKNMMGYVNDLLSSNGSVASVDDENMMDAVTAISGSGPAYLFYFIECLIDAGLEAGLPENTASLLAIETVYGAASLVKESGAHPYKLREQVTSPNGVTAAALDVLADGDKLRSLICETVARAADRSGELSR